MVNELKRQIVENQFVKLVRTELRFDENEYQALTSALRELAVSVKGSDTIDKELALTLYCIPQFVRNAFLSFPKESDSRPAIADKLEDVWMELDQLVIDCLK